MRKWRILAVDDDPDVCVAIHVILRDKYEVVTENSGRAALEWLDVIEPDFIILDVRMPDLDGYAVCRRIRSDNQFRDTPILFLSVLDSPEDVRKAYEVGANLYLAKPFDPIRLLKNIDVFVERTPPVFRKKRYELEELAVVTAYVSEGETQREEQVAPAAPSRAPRRHAAGPPAESRPPRKAPPLVTRADEITFITEPEEIEEEELETAPPDYEPPTRRPEPAPPASRRTPRRREPVQETPAEEEHIEEPPVAAPFRELRPAKRRAAKPAAAEMSAAGPGSLGPRGAEQTPIERTAARVERRAAGVGRQATGLERRVGPRERRVPAPASSPIPPTTPGISSPSGPSSPSSASAPSTPFPPSAPPASSAPFTPSAHFSPFTPPPQTPSREGRRPRVLFVLDDSDELAQLADACEDKFEFVWSDNSLTAFENLDLYEPDVLFIDAAGPNINGFELGRAIRAHLAYKNTPIVFYSSDSSFRQRQMAKRAGASDFLKRPAAPGQVTAMLERQLAASKAKIRRKKNTIEQILDLIEFGPSTSGPDEAI